MSTSDLYIIYKTTSRHVAEYQNGHGTAPIIWDYLCQEYLDVEDNCELDWDKTRNIKELWNLAKDKRVPLYLRICHAMTFDWAIVKATDLQIVANAIEASHTILYNYTCKFRGRKFSERVNHWKDIAEDLRKVKVAKNAIGVGLSCTSIYDPWRDIEMRDAKLFDAYDYVMYFENEKKEV